MASILGLEHRRSSTAAKTESSNGTMPVIRIYMIMPALNMSLDGEYEPMKHSGAR